MAWGDRAAIEGFELQPLSVGSRGRPASRRRRARTVRRLRGTPGNFRTRGRHSSATVRGTVWTRATAATARSPRSSAAGSPFATSAASAPSSSAPASAIWRVRLERLRPALPGCTLSHAGGDCPHPLSRTRLGGYRHPARARRRRSRGVSGVDGDAWFAVAGGGGADGVCGGFHDVGWGVTSGRIASR